MFSYSACGCTVATHVHGNILDLVLSTDPSMVEDVLVGDFLPTSDHLGISFDLIFNVSKHDTKTVIFDYRKGNYEAMRSYLEEFDWVSLFADKSVEETWSLVLVTV